MDRSPKKMIRVGLVGTGHIAPYHLQAIRRIEDIVVIGVYDSDANRLRSFVAQHNLGVAFESYDRLLEQVDVVHILTPPESHADLALRAIEAGCHVFVEKPLAVTADACDEIAEAARRAGRIVGVDHSLLCDPFTRRALELVQQGKIGRVVSVHCTRSQDYPEYEGGPLPPHTRDAAFPFADLGIHSLYQIELFLGPVENMQWTMRHQGSDYQLAFDEWHALVECRDGNAQLYLSWNARPLQDVLMVLGTKGVLRLDRFGMHVTTKLQGRLPEHPRRAWNAVWEAVQIGAQVPMNLARFMTGRLRRYHGLQDMVHEFYESVRTNRPARVGPEDARRVVSWVERISADARRRWNIQRADCESAGNAKTLVTGATGFIGGHLLQRLLDEARPVRILCRHLPPQAIRSNPLVEAVIGDLGDPEVVDRAMRGIQCVYHLGGTVHGTSQQFWRGNVRGTENVITSALRHQVSQVIYVSSLSVLQAANVGDTVLREDAVLECHPERRGLYTQTKLVAEKKVLKAAQDQGLPVVVVRPGEVIGPGAQLLSSGVAHRMANRLIIMGDGHLRLPLIHVGDLVDALRACEAKQIVDGTVVHLVDPNAATQNEMADAWQKLMGRSTPVFHVPKGLLFPLGWCSEWVFRIVGKNSPMSIYRLKSALTNRRFDTSRASQLLEWTPQRGIWRGLQDTIESNRAGTDCDSTPSEPDGILAHHVISNN